MQSPAPYGVQGKTPKAEECTNQVRRNEKDAAQSASGRQLDFLQSAKLILQWKLFYSG